MDLEGDVSQNTSIMYSSIVFHHVNVTAVYSEHSDLEP